MKTTRTLNRPSLAWSVTIAVGQLALVGCAGDDPGAGMNAPVGAAAAAGVTAMGVGASAGTLSGPDATAQGGASGAAGGGDATAGGASAGTGSTNAGAPAVVVPPPDEPSAGFIRRLTHIEYDNTVADLLGVDTQPSSAFAADIALQGFTNNAAGQNVTPTLTEQYIQAAESVSRAATEDLTGLLGCDPETIGEEACVQQFIPDFGKRAWRRPLSAEELGRMSDLFTAVRADYELDVSIQLVVQAFLLSPQFGYLVEQLPAGATPGSIVALDSWKVATRLSYFLLGSMPDAELLAAAEADELQTPEAVAAQARRLLTLPQARERVGLFHTEWLRLRHLDKLQKDATLFPDYDLSWGPMLREQVERFAQAVILDDGGTAADLLTAPFTFVNPKLAPLYGVPRPLSDEFARVELDPMQRAGLLTHAAVLANLAHQDQTDPVVRGKFIRESVLCESVPPPPVGLIVTPPVVAPGSTTRERFSQHRSDPACGGCHALMDPIGLGFEHYDPLGQWRDLDNGLAVDATGEVIGTDVGGTFDGAIELSQKLAASEQAMACFAETWFRFALGRSQQEADHGALAVAGDRFKASGFQMSELLVALTETRAFRYQQVLSADTSALQDMSTSTEEEETP